MRISIANFILEFRKDLVTRRNWSQWPVVHNPQHTRSTLREHRRAEQFVALRALRISSRMPNDEPIDKKQTPASRRRLRRMRSRELRNAEKGISEPCHGGGAVVVSDERGQRRRKPRKRRGRNTDSTDADEYNASTLSHLSAVWLSVLCDDKNPSQTNNSQDSKPGYEVRAKVRESGQPVQMNPRTVNMQKGDWVIYY